MIHRDLYFINRKEWVLMAGISLFPGLVGLDILFAFALAQDSCGGLSHSRHGIGKPASSGCSPTSLSKAGCLFAINCLDSGLPTGGEIRGIGLRVADCSFSQMSGISRRVTDC